MANKPPLTDSIAIALARLVDDAQSERRDPSHSDIEFQINKANLSAADPGQQSSKPIGKNKRVRGVLNWALSNNVPAGEQLVAGLIATVQASGGFRPSSQNYCGTDAIANLAATFLSHGWELGTDGSLQPKVLESLSGKALTSALNSYADRARRGSLDSPLLVGTAKDLLEATAGHVLAEKWSYDKNTSNFPTLLGQAFTALNMATPSTPVAIGELATKRVERSAYELGCALNALRNKEGTGHGRPWISNVTPSEARFAIESMGNIAALMLSKM